MYIIGVDECGWGAWAGPLVVCAFALPVGWTADYLRDSKKLSRKAREVAYGNLYRMADSIEEFGYVLAWRTAQEIDTMGAAKAWNTAVVQAIQNCESNFGPEVEDIILDGDRSPIRGITCEPKADGKYPAVMAASIVGKVLRDRHMVEMSKQYKGYDWEKNVGYGTDRHREMLDIIGITPLHRRSYQPMLTLFPRTMG